MAYIFSTDVNPNVGWSEVNPQGIQYRVIIRWRITTSRWLPSLKDYEIATYDLIEPPAFVRGRSVDGVSLGNLEVGQCSMTALNIDGKYSRRNKSSPIYDPDDNSYIGAGRLVEIYLRDPNHLDRVGSLVWSGVLTDVIADTSDPLIPTVTITAQGPLYLYSDQNAKIDYEGHDTAVSTGTMAREAVFGERFPHFFRSSSPPRRAFWLDWETTVTGYQQSGGALGILGDLEVLEAGGRVYETKRGHVRLTGNVSARAPIAVFLDAPSSDSYTLADGTSVPAYRISSAHEINAEALIYDCFNYTVQESTYQDYASDGTKALIHTQTLPTTDDDGMPSNGEFIGSYEFPAGEESGVTFSGIRWLPEETRFHVKFAADVAGLASVPSNHDLWMRAGALGSNRRTPDDNWNVYRFTNPVVTVSADKKKIEWRFRRRGSIETLKAWIVEVEYYGVRIQQIQEGEIIARCLERPSVIDQVGKREFPIQPDFKSIAEAERWVGVMAARYTEERLRLSVEIIPSAAKEFHELSDIELGERVQLELTGTEPTSSRLYIDSGKPCIVERVEHVPLDGFAGAFVFDLLDASYYDAPPVPASGFTDPAPLSPTGD
jgi:hypothetical protein